MVSTLKRGGLDLATSQCRQLFPQSSQPTPSQHLNNAMSKCRLGSQTAMSSQADGQSAEPCFSQGIAVTSQDYLPGSQDFITPADQQFATAEDALKAGRCMPTPAPLSPNRLIKRPRNALEESDVLDCSQASQRTSMHPPGPSSVYEDCAGPRKRLTRMPSPPCARNIFIDGPEEDATPVSLMHRRPPFVSRFRQEFDAHQMVYLNGGNYAKVHRVKSKFDGVEYAIKRSRTAVTSEAEAKRWQQEAMAMAAAGSHPAIVRYYSAWTEREDNGGQHFYILMELCGASLHDMCTGIEGHKFNDTELLDILRQMAEALQHLHGRNIVHMDVKPDNIYAAREGNGFKLGDFGLATASSGAAYCQEGDARYVPAEVLNDDFRALDKADVFMLGASLYELASGVALESSGATYQKLRAGELPPMLPGRSTSLCRLIRRMCAPVPANRPSPAQILADPLFTKRAGGSGSGNAASAKENRSNYGPLGLAAPQRG